MLHRRASAAFFEPISLIVIGALLVAACGDGALGGDDAAVSEVDDRTAVETTVGEDAAASTDTTSSDDALVEPVEDAPIEEPPADAAADDTDAGDGGCLVGSWVITDGAMNGYYDALEASPEMAAGGDVDFTIVGDTTVEFRADGTYTYRPDFALMLATGGMTGEGVASGELSGEYTVEDGVVTTTVTDDGVEMVITVAGITMSSSEMGMDVGDIAPISSAPIDCSGPNPTLGFELADGSRIPVELQPA